MKSVKIAIMQWLINGVKGYESVYYKVCPFTGECWCTNFIVLVTIKDVKKPVKLGFRYFESAQEFQRKVTRIRTVINTQIIKNAFAE